jgi:hypothetical protein
MPGLDSNRGAKRAREARESLGLDPAAPLGCLLTVVETRAELPVVVTALPADVAGACYRDERGVVLWLNGGQPCTRQRFTLAHEVGHAWCRHDGRLELAHRLFNHVAPRTGRPTRTLLLSATPYRMYTTADEPDADHYEDFLATCRFLYGGDEARVRRLQERLDALRAALTSTGSLDAAGATCAALASELRSVMARTERLAATPDRDGMLTEHDPQVSLEQDDLRAYLRLADLAEAVGHHEPADYWKSGSYLMNFMERYKLKEAFDDAAQKGQLELDPGPGLLAWDDVEAYEPIDPQNGRLRWLLDDLERHRAFELLWLPLSLRYYDAGSVYESDAAMRFTKRLIFSGWAVVPKVVSALVSFEGERLAFTDRSHSYSADYRRRGGQPLAFRTEERTTGESASRRRAAAMTAFLLVWPSVELALLGDPRPHTRGARPNVADLLAGIEARVADELQQLTAAAPRSGPVDQRWYWAAPLLLDDRRHRAGVDVLLNPYAFAHWVMTRERASASITRRRARWSSRAPTHSAGRRTTSRACWPSWRWAARRNAPCGPSPQSAAFLWSTKGRWPGRPGSRQPFVASSTRRR